MDKSLPLSVGPAGDAGDLPPMLVLPDAPSPLTPILAEWKVSLEISCRTEARSWHPCWRNVGLWGVQGAQHCSASFWVACSAAGLSCLKNPGLVEGVMAVSTSLSMALGPPGCGACLRRGHGSSQLASLQCSAHALWFPVPGNRIYGPPHLQLSPAFSGDWDEPVPRLWGSECAVAELCQG